MKYILTLLSALLFTTACIAQSKFAGDWEGKIKAGVTLRIILHIRDTTGKLSGTMDSPDQGAYGLKCSSVTITHDTLDAKLEGINAAYKGYLTDSDILNGQFTQGTRSIALNLIPADKVVPPKRPQTPKPPFNYKIENVVYRNPDSTIQYGATLTIPNGKGPFPAVLLITGSGQQNRDEEIFGHKPFAVIADYLTKKGYVVMRVDDRGIGQTTGDVTHATTKDFEYDTNVSLNYLKTHKQVDPKKIGLMGHSEGGLIAEMLASERKDIDFIVLLAAPGVKITTLMEEQNAALIEQRSDNKEALIQFKKLYESMIKVTLTDSKDSMKVRRTLSDTIQAWEDQAPPSILKGIGLTTFQAQMAIISQFYFIYSNPWYHYFIKLNPQDYLEKLSCKVLAINGSKDIEVIAKTNLEGIHEGLEKSKSKQYNIHEIPGLNHLFQTCKECSVAEYGDLEETFAPAALNVIGDWMDKYVK